VCIALNLLKTRKCRIYEVLPESTVYQRWEVPNKKKGAECSHSSANDYSKKECNVSRLSKDQIDDLCIKKEKIFGFEKK
jgi:hypothetical protein